jgi:hypothetical protein
MQAKTGTICALDDRSRLAAEACANSGEMWAGSVQNIERTVLEIKVPDCTAIAITNQTTKTFTNTECHFGYRRVYLK